MDNLNNQNPNGFNGEPQNESSVGALIGSIIVIGVLVFGAIYFWGRNFSQEQVPVQDGSGAESDPESLEQELQNESVENIDAEFNQTLETEV